MDGLLLRLLHDTTGRPGFFFWKLFGSIQQDLNRLFWCFSNQPWMGPPADFQEDESVMASFPGEESTSIQLWRPGSLSRYADRFMEESIELWGIEPTRDDPLELAARYKREGDEVIRQHAQVWLLYTDSTCWEIYARKTRLLERLRTDLQAKSWLEIYTSRDDCRGLAFQAAGLSNVWIALNRRSG